MASAHETGSEPSLSDLFRNLVEDTRRLMRDEIQLARTEMTEKAIFAGKQALHMAIGAVLALFGVVALLGALTMGVAHLLTPLTGREAALWIAPLLMALIAGGAGAFLLLGALRRLKTQSLTPHKTLQSMRETGQVVVDRFKS